MAGGRNEAELRLLFELDGSLKQVCAVKLGQKGDLYFLNHHPAVGGKDSRHPSGTLTHEVRLLGRREYGHQALVCAISVGSRTCIGSAAAAQR